MTAFASERAWRLNPQVALRDESFGALAYHYGNRRLVFLKSRLLVDLCRRSVSTRARARRSRRWCPRGSATRYGRALARLAASEVIDVR